MKQASSSVKREHLGRVSTHTKGSGGPNIEMVGLWHKPTLGG